ncbi:MAG: MarR family transcriptional regulator [Oscillospiraceae bacterium]|nr:MarR family transcriptional regulator [Oscillospiraceae bacterium]
MNLDIEMGLGAISAGVSRIDGLYSKWAQKHGVTYGVIQVLYILKLNQAVTQKKISEYCQIPKQTVNSVIKQFKADQYITLVPSTGDKRERIIQLTPIGETYLREMLDPFFVLNERVVDRIGIDLLRHLSEGLNTLGNAIELEMELKETSLKWEKRKRG